jgi:hypothetical protein
MIRLIAVGSLLGVIWAAGLPAWMMQLAGPTGATSTALILAAAGIPDALCQPSLVDFRHE